MPDSDPCQSLLDQVADLKGQIKGLQDGINAGGPKQGVGAQINKLNGELTTAQAALEKCQNDHIVCTVSGAAVPALAELDKAMLGVMRDQGATAGQLAVARNGVIKFSRAYTCQKPSFGEVTPSSVFRLASVSKAFTCAGTKILTDDGTKVKTSTEVFPFLGITAPSLSTQTLDPDVNNITVQHLIDHAGGWIDQAGLVTAKDGSQLQGTGFDPVFQVRKIALDMHLPGPPDKFAIARYMFGHDANTRLSFKPGTQDFNTTGGASYSNFGYMLLGLVVEEASGQPYVDFVRDHVLAPLKVADIYQARMLAGRLRRREVTYIAEGTGPNAIEPHSSVQAALAYGGGGFLTELMDGGGGLMGTCDALVRFLAQNAAWGMGPRSPGAARTGGMKGTATRIMSRGDGLDFAYAFNMRIDQLPNGVDDQLSTKINAILDGATVP